MRGVPGAAVGDEAETGGSGASGIAEPEVHAGRTHADGTDPDSALRRPHSAKCVRQPAVRGLEGVQGGHAREAGEEDLRVDGARGEHEFGLVRRGCQLTEQAGPPRPPCQRGTRDGPDPQCGELGQPRGRRPRVGFGVMRSDREGPLVGDRDGRRLRRGRRRRRRRGHRVRGQCGAGDVRGRGSGHQQCPAGVDPARVHEAQTVRHHPAQVQRGDGGPVGPVSQLRVGDRPQ